MIRKIAVATVLILGSCAGVRAADVSADPAKAPAIQAAPLADSRLVGGPTMGFVHFPSKWIEHTGTTERNNPKVEVVEDESNRVLAILTGTVAGPGATVETVLPLLPKIMAAKVNDYKQIDCGFVTVNGTLAARLDFEGSVDGEPTARCCMIMMLSKTGVFSNLTLTCTLADANRVAPIFMQIAASLKPATEGPVNAAAAAPAAPADPGAALLKRMAEASHHDAIRPPVYPQQLRAAAPPVLPNATAADQQFKSVESHWQPTLASPIEAINDMRIMPGQLPDGSAIIRQGERMMTAKSYSAPVTYRIVALTNVNDFRIGGPAKQIIFNWESNADQLRVEGGPLDGKHKDDAGRLPANQWVGIEIAVTRSGMTIWVNGQQRYQEDGDFSNITQPLTLVSHSGETRIKSVTVVK